ncbi:MAG: polyprotein [Fushun cicadella viridis iflavirus 1]|nr:MAG: polyprotein [Fushun cicadella viridis iflavirus 1]
MPFFNFGFTQFELAEFDLSIPMRSKTVRPRVVKDDDSFNRFSYVWSRPRVEKKVSPSPRPAPPTPRERFRSSLLKRYAGRPLVFYFAHSRFLGDSKSRVVAPFYKEIFEILKKDALKASRYQRRRAPAEKKKLVFPSNRYTLLENEDSPDCEEWEDEDVEFTPRVKRSTPRDQAFIGPRNLPACPKERDGKLLLKLKMVLTHLEGVRTGRRDWCRLRIVHLLSRYALLSEKDVVPQMDEEIVVDKKSNTTTMNTTGQEVIQPIPTVISDFWTKASTSDSLHRYDEFCDRWHVLSNLIWSSDDKRDKVLLDVPLPFQFLKDNAKSPNFVPFAQYAYWKGDISIRIHLNTTMYNVGSLIVSWYYGASFDSNKSLRLYRPACVQLPHAMINASDSNDVVLNIPYRSYKSMLSMYKKESDVHFAELGNLRLVVFNPLLLSSVDTTTSVSITTYVSFPNSQFTGLIPRDDTQFTVIQPQMFPLIKAKKIVNFASDAMDMFIPDPNRDNPPIVERPMSVAPIATGNWASGNNDIDLLNTLRLEPSGQTPHPVGSSTSKDEMDIRSVVSQWGFLTTLDWKVDSVVGTLLTTINASPIQTIYDDYDIAFGTLSRKCNIYTPVHNVANMFSLWRGELELKVEIISSAFQVGSLIIGYCPRRNYKLTSKNSLSLIKSMYNCTIDLETQSSFVFKIPYIADKPWWPVTAKIDDNNVRSRIDPPGFVYVAVLNQLIAAKSLVPTTCYINLYLRASDSFEVSLLSNPRIGLSFDITSSKQSIIHTVVGPSYAKEFAVGVWRYTGDAPIVFRYGSGSDHITQFLNLKPNVVYEATEGFGSVIAISYKRPVLHAKLNYDIHSGIPKYLVRFIVNGDRDTYSYGAPFCTKDEAHNFINHNPADIYANSNLAWLLRYNANDYIKLLDDASGVVWTVLYEDVVPQMDNDLILDTASSSLVSTSAGHMTFGERVTSLKSICRRYQHYKSISYTPDKLDSFGNLSKGVLIPLKPDGLDIDQTTFMENLRRDGVIGYVCSAYRFFRGSLRFKFVFRSDIQGMVYLQHVFDQELADNDYLIEQPSVNTSRMLQPGYAIVAQNLNLNNVVSFETPFYLPTNLGLLQNPIEGIGKIESVVKSLGYIYMHYQSSPSSMVGKTFVDIFYSFGDDMSLSCFVGFPPVFEISTLEDQWKPKKKEDSFEIIEPQMGLFNNKYSAPTISPEELTNIIDLLRNYINLLHTPLPNLEGSKDAALNRVVVQFTAVTSDSTFGAFVGHFLPAKLDTRLKVDRMLVRDPKDLYNYLYRKYKENASVVVSDHFVKQHPDSIKAKIEWNNKSFMEKLDSKLDEKVSNFSKSVVKDSKEAVSEVLEKQDAGIWDYIKSIAEIVGGDVKHLLMSSFTHIMHVLISPSLSTFAVAIIGVLITLGLICTSMVTKLISLMTTMYKDVFELMKKWSTPSSSVSATPTKTEIGGASGADVVAQAGPEKLELSSTDKATLLATLVGGITGIVAHGHKISTRNIPDFTSGLFKGITEVSRGCNFLTVFFKNNLEMFQKILRYVTNKLFPRRAFQLTIEDEEEYMKAWFEDVRELNDPRNLDAVMHDPAWNVRVYQAAVVAEAYKLKFLSSDVRPNPLLISTCNKIIELRDKLASEKISPPVRFEPWVLCISGATAIGKSHMADSLADTLLESINYRSYSEKVYTRTPGNPYWNQLRSQPVLLYDDFCQVATPEARAMDMSELFCLKSKAVFNPPQAAIEDKHIRYNPLVVMLLCNRPYMHIAQVTDQNAWMRRRDLIINARIVPRFAHLHVRDIPSEITKAYGHLEFDIYRSSVSENEGFSHTNLTYAELQDILRTRFNNFYQQELIHYNARLAASTRFMPDRDEAIENTIERYNKHLEIINAQNKIQDAEIIFNGQTYKDNMLPAFLRDRHVEPQMNGEVCKHSLMKRDWEFTDDITELQQNYGSLADCVGITGKVSAFYDANEISQWVTAEPCTDVSCYWKLENQKKLSCHYEELEIST